MKNRVYGVNSPFEHISSPVSIAKRNPTVNDKQATLGEVWINENTGSLFTFVGVKNNQARWVSKTSAKIKYAATGALVSGVLTDVPTDVVLLPTDLVIVTRRSPQTSTSLGGLVGTINAAQNEIRITSVAIYTPTTLETGDSSIVDYTVYAS